MPRSGCSGLHGVKTNLKKKSINILVKAFIFWVLSDRNECNDESHGCQQKCVNEYGSYSCVCLNGYKLSDDKKTCSGKIL